MLKCFGEPVTAPYPSLQQLKKNKILKNTYFKFCKKEFIHEATHHLLVRGNLL